MALPRDVETAYEAFSGTVYGSTVLPRKQIELMALSVSVAVDCVPCMRHHSAEAKKHGATDDEIGLAVGVAMSVSAGKNRVKAREALER